MKLSEMVAGFIARPFDPNNDGETDLLELAVVVGVIAALAFGWSRVINSLMEG